MTNYYFDHNFFYTHSLPANVGSTAPLNASRVKPEIKDGFISKWNTNTLSWDNIKDNRNVAFWLPEDKYDSPARFLSIPGEFPEDAIFTTPSKEFNESISDYKIVVQNRLDAFAHSEGREYDNIVAVRTYQNSTIPQFKAEAERASYLQDITWLAANDIFQKITDGEIEVPSIEEFLSMLPELTWEEPIELN